MDRAFDEHGLDTDLLNILSERFESRFKAVQSEQRQIHNLATTHSYKRARCQKFSDEINADDLEVADHAA